MNSVNGILLYPQRPSYPKNGDAWVNYSGKLEIYFQNNWNIITTQDEVSSMVSAFHTNMSAITAFQVHHNGRRMNEIVETIVALFVNSGIIESEKDFFDFLSAKRLADKLETDGEKNENKK